MKRHKVHSEKAKLGNQETDNLSEEVKMDNENKLQENNTAELNDTASAEQSNGQDDSATQKPDFEAMAFEWKDKYMRLSADFDNYRKRTLKEKIELSKFAGEDVLRGLLPVVDDFERGLKNLELATDLEAMKEGINLIYNKFRDFLTQKGLKEIEALNVDFNTDFHEAITKIPVEDKAMSGKIVDVVQKGYTIDEKVVRFSKVVVGE